MDALRDASSIVKLVLYSNLKNRENGLVKPSAIMKMLQIIIFSPHMDIQGIKELWFIGLKKHLKRAAKGPNTS